MDITGRVKEVMDPMTFPSGAVKREFVVTTEDQYPQDLMFELWKDKVNMVANCRPNDRVKVSFDIRSRQVNGRYYTSLAAWRIETADQTQGTSGPVAPVRQAPPMPQSAPMPESFTSAPDDDLPF